MLVVDEVDEQKRIVQGRDPGPPGQYNGELVAIWDVTSADTL